MDIKEIQKGELPPIKTGDEVSEDEPQVIIGEKKASLPPPIIFRED